MKFYAPEKISAKRSRTPEGYLLVEGTPIARTGIQDYHASELGYRIPGDSNEIVRVERTPEEVFSPVAMASYNGKSLTNDHPDDLLDPTTWRQSTVGVVMNPRRGEGPQSDLLIADIMVMDPEAIEAIEAGKTELSGGYNAEYVELGPGRAAQRNIVGNHVALVDQGRCGSRCAIGDHTQCERESKMTYKDRLMKLFKVKTSDELMKALDEAPEGEEEKGDHTHIHIHDEQHGETHEVGGEDPIPGLTARMDALEGMMKPVHDYVMRKVKDESEEEKKKKEEEETKDESAEEEAEELAEETGTTKDKAKAFTDSAPFTESWKATLAAAEILVPGLAAPVFDAKAKPKATLDAICGFRRKALDLAYATPAGRNVIDAFLAGRAFDTKTMSCAKVRETFLAAVAAQKTINNGSNTSHAKATNGKKPVGIRSIADLQRRAQELYGPKNNATN